MQLGWPPSALNGLDSQPRKKHKQQHGREDVLLNQGIGLGKSAGRPFLPSSSLQQQTYKTDDTFSSIGLDQEKERGRRLPHTKSKLQQFFFFSFGWGFLLMW